MRRGVIARIGLLLPFNLYASVMATSIPIESQAYGTAHRSKIPRICCRPYCDSVYALSDVLRFIRYWHARVTLLTGHSSVTLSGVGDSRESLKSAYVRDSKNLELKCKMLPSAVCVSLECA